MTMPELRRWFQWLSARLRHVRIINGDWRRVCTTGASKTLIVRQKQGVAGIFLDPPYADTASRSDGLYAQDSLTVAHDVRDWCLKNGDDPDYRIVLAGFEGEHGDSLTAAGWREVEWFKAGHLRGGMAQQGANGHQQHRERLWLSPYCLTTTMSPQTEMWDDDND
jgi:DNA adenine methylase